MPAYKDKDRGTWYVKYSAVDPITGKRRQILKRGFRTKRDALDYEASQRNAEVPSSITFEELSRRYFDYRDASLKTRAGQEKSLDHVSFMDKQVNQITKNDLMGWYLDLSKKNWTASSKNQLLTLVKSIFRHGSDFYELKNPAVVLKRFKKEKSDLQVWTPEQFKQFEETVDLTVYRTYFYFLYWTGCRKSEALQIRYDDFDGDRVHIRGTKTPTSDRWLLLNPKLLGALKRLRDASSAESPYLFGGKSPLPVSTIDAAWKRYLYRSKVTPIRIHDLRHSFASNAIASGANIVAVSKYLGHANVGITMQVYAHLLEKTEADMVERMEKLM